MSNVTSAEIVNATARAYGFSRDMVLAGGPATSDNAERRRRLQARMVSAYLIRRHRSDSRRAICEALNLPISTSSYELVDLALSLAGRYREYDQDMAARMDKAEARIDELHERRMERLHTQQTHSQMMTA